MPNQSSILNTVTYSVDRSNVLFRSLFCSFLWPRHPGLSGGEIRDFHILRRLLSVSEVEFFSVHNILDDNRNDPLAPYVTAMHSPQATCAEQPELVRPQEASGTLWDRIVTGLRQKHVPLPGFRYHLDITFHMRMASAYTTQALQKALFAENHDFLFIGPQCNPVALTLNTTGLNTRLIMASYDVEFVRIQRLTSTYSGVAKFTAKMETRRAARFERENLAAFDGIIAVSDFDKEIFLRTYHFEPERVLTIDNSVDPLYFSFKERDLSDTPNIIFTGSFGYPPNKQAALRLIHGIMPLVRKQYANARAWIVGQSPDSELLACHDGKHTFVTGRVEDVRPYLAMATLTCIPLLAGSGTKYKILEAMSAGVPVVCSPLAGEGLDLEDGKHLLIGKTDADLGALILRILNNATIGSQLAKEAHDQIEKRYSWDANLAALDSWLNKMLSIPRRIIA